MLEKYGFKYYITDNAWEKDNYSITYKKDKLSNVTWKMVRFDIFYDNIFKETFLFEGNDNDMIRFLNIIFRKQRIDSFLNE